MNNLPNCPKCNSEYVYEDGALLVCPECAYEWNPAEVEEEEGVVAIDANGNKLADGDTVTLIKDLKVKGAPKDLKQGTRVKNIRIVEGELSAVRKVLETVLFQVLGSFETLGSKLSHGTS